MSEAIDKLIKSVEIKKEPVEKFLQMVSTWPAQLTVTDLCCKALGWRTDDSEDFLSYPEPVKEMYRPGELADLREQFAVVQKVGIQPKMLIPGLLHYLLACFRQQSQETTTSDIIDHDLEHLRKLQEQQEKPLSQRHTGFTDDFIKKAMDRVKEVAQQRTNQRILAKSMVERLENDWKRVFPDNYWDDWTKRLMDVI